MNFSVPLRGISFMKKVQIRKEDLLFSICTDHIFINMRVNII